MPFTAGDTLGPYEILARIGQGGMGEVYRARDTRLGRDVAIKVSQEKFSERFEREARAIAALNHPNVCALYDVGPNYLVMEYVEGQAPSGPLELDEALAIAQQIAAALAEAHEKGIVHRDLKPANIKVREDGTVKVLDFGLAKALHPDVASGSVETSPTKSLALTQAGVILGTAAYMAPEQARGRRVDARADIWAFGVVLYELLTGRKLFQGEDVAEIVANVVREQPDLSVVPYRVRKLLEACLQKDPRKRLQAITDWRLPLMEEPVSAAPAAARRPLAWIVAAVAVTMAAVVSFLHFRETPPERAVTRFQVLPPGNSDSAMLRLSPDGRTLALVAVEGGRSQLWIRPLDSLEAQPLRGTEEARYPFWSPDSAFLGFFAQGQLKKIALAGGPAQILCAAADGRGGTWNRDGVIVFSPGPTSGLQRVAAAGGVPAVATQLEAGASGHRFPEFLPDGRHFLFLADTNKAETTGVHVGSLDGKPPMRIRGGVSNAVFAPAAARQPGFLLFREGDTLMAQPFDPERLSFSGEMFPVAERVGEGGNLGFGAFTVSANGTLAYRAGRAFFLGNRELVWLDRTGKRQAIRGVKPGPVYDGALSPDQKRIALTIATSEGVADIWLLDLGRAAITRFTFGPLLNADPLWSPEGSRLAFLRREQNSSGDDIYQKALAGAGEERLLEGGVNVYPTDWSRDGKFLVYERYGKQMRRDLWLLPLAGDGPPRPYLQTPFDEVQGQFSPDGRWMAYVSNESGQEQVYVQPIPVSGAKWQISTAGGQQPRWRQDGRELFYLGADGRRLMAVPVPASASGSFEPGTPQALFESPGAFYRGYLSGFGYQPTADGQHFLALLPAEGEAPPPVAVVLNWQAGLKR